MRRFVTVPAAGLALAAALTGPAAADPTDLDVYGVLSQLNSVGLGPVAPCVPSSVDIVVGDLTGAGLADLANPGDVYYRWAAPTAVKVGGHCDRETISRVTYRDQPIMGAGLLLQGGPYEVRAKDDPARRYDATALQAPEWLVLYYSARNGYARAVFGSLSVQVEAAYVDARTGVEVRAGCKTRTWYFAASPQGPTYTASTSVSNC